MQRLIQTRDSLFSSIAAPYTKTTSPIGPVEETVALKHGIVKVPLIAQATLTSAPEKKG